MSQIEQKFHQFLSKNPEIESCYSQGLINRRSLARFLIDHKVAKQSQLGAVIAMLRRFNFKGDDKKIDLFPKTKINIKDNILIMDFEKEKELIKELQHLIADANYDKGDTLKIVIGSSSVKVFLDQENEAKLKKIIENHKIKNRMDNISELSIMFPKDAIVEKGVLSTITREFCVNDIFISELLTASPELLIYIKEEFVIKAYDILKRLQKKE